jgi:hypothetical protein
MRDIFPICAICSARVKYRMNYELLKSRIDVALERADTTANRVSAELGWDRSYVGKIGDPKNGDGVPEPSAVRMKILAYRLGVPVEWFINAIDPTPNEMAKGLEWPPIEDATPPAELGADGAGEGDAQVNSDLPQKSENELLLDIWERLDLGVQAAALTLIKAINRATKKAS